MYENLQRSSRLSTLCPGTVRCHFRAVSSFACIRDMAPRASYLPFEGSTDDADPGVWQPWWYLTPNPRHIANTDPDTDATGRQVPVDVHVQDRSSFDHASDHYQNLDYFNPWQESPLQAPPDRTTYSARTPGMPVRLDLRATFIPNAQRQY